MCQVADGWRLRLPLRDWVIFHFTLQGEGTLRLGSGEVYALSPNSLAVIPPGLIHSVECGSDVRNESVVDGQGDVPPICDLVAGPEEDSRLKIACGRVQVSYAGSLGLFDLLQEPLVLDFSDSPTMRATFEALVQEPRTDVPGRVAMMSALMNQCLILIFRRLGQHPDCKLPWLSALDDARLARVMEAILEHPEHPHSLDSLGTLANMSRSVFAKRFHECFGRPPMDFVREARLRRGAHLLHRSDLSVDDVANRVGFSSRSHFSRAFRDYFGHSPASFREQIV